MFVLTHNSTTLQLLYLHPFLSRPIGFQINDETEIIHHFTMINLLLFFIFNQNSRLAFIAVYNNNKNHMQQETYHIQHGLVQSCIQLCGEKTSEFGSGA